MKQQALFWTGSVVTVDCSTCLVREKKMHWLAKYSSLILLHVHRSSSSRQKKHSGGFKLRLRCCDTRQGCAAGVNSESRSCVVQYVRVRLLDSAVWRGVRWPNSWADLDCSCCRSLVLFSFISGCQPQQKTPESHETLLGKVSFCSRAGFSVSAALESARCSKKKWFLAMLKKNSLDYKTLRWCWGTPCFFTA